MEKKTECYVRQNKTKKRNIKGKLVANNAMVGWRTVRKKEQEFRMWSAHMLGWQFGEASLSIHPLATL